jgi:hypothetical protein
MVIGFVVMGCIASSSHGKFISASSQLRQWLILNAFWLWNAISTQLVDIIAE